MTQIKLTTRKPLDATHSLTLAADLMLALNKAERVAPITVHSHGQMLEQAKAEAEKALRIISEYQREVQGR